MNFPKNIIKRKGYIDKIKPFIRKSIAKVLTGQHRVGKSFLPYQIWSEQKLQEIRINRHNSFISRFLITHTLIKRQQIEEKAYKQINKMHFSCIFPRKKDRYAFYFKMLTYFFLGDNSGSSTSNDSKLYEEP